MLPQPVAARAFSETQRPEPKLAEGPGIRIRRPVLAWLCPKQPCPRRRHLIWPPRLQSCLEGGAGGAHGLGPSVSYPITMLME